MKLRFKQQKFQADAVKAVVDIFDGQPPMNPSYMMDRGTNYQGTLTEDEDYTGWSNAPVQPQVAGEDGKAILERIQRVQRDNFIKQSRDLEGRYNLTIEMETGVGKTYTYIKTMYELNQHYGWKKFIIVVPSVAIREGVYKSFQVTQEHFAEMYGQKIRFFIYDSSRLSEIDHFASDKSINAMIINIQAFNTREEEGRRILTRQDVFRSRKPIDVLAKTNPVIIIDEPQSVNGEATRGNLKKFNPLMTLRYSATHRPDAIYNMIYRLDAVDAYNQRLVKKIAVKGISVSGTTATEGFIYLERINLSKGNPTATIQIEVKGKGGIRQKTFKVCDGMNLYDLSNGLEQYKNNFVVSKINGLDNSIKFLNGMQLYVGEGIGQSNDNQLRRIQIRETIRSHFERERQLFQRGIKVLSLFFIDKVVNYRQYDADNRPLNGPYANMFEEEYEYVLNELKSELVDEGLRKYLDYLEQIETNKTHAGYFSIDKNTGNMRDPRNAHRREGSDDITAYELIMKDKERLLDCDPKRSPVRFIFSHSALKEGWDNPNVFQIGILKNCPSVSKKKGKKGNDDSWRRQEIGRGLRLCVNSRGERMDESILGDDVHNVNVLTVIANESYEAFAKGLQTELSNELTGRPRAVDYSLFVDEMVLKNDESSSLEIDESTARILCDTLYQCGYLEKIESQSGSKKRSKKADEEVKYRTTEKFYEDKTSGSLVIEHGIANFTDYSDAIAKILDSVYDNRKIEIENARGNIDVKLNREKLKMKEFKNLWEKINTKTAYVVDFETQELVDKSISALNAGLRVNPIYARIQAAALERIDAEGTVVFKEGNEKEESLNKGCQFVSDTVKYDLVGKLVEGTNLTRKTVVQILTGIEVAVFNQFKSNPEEFILKAVSLINDEKAVTIVNHITYNVCEEKYETTLFTDATIKGQLDKNLIETKKHLYDHVRYDSSNEADFTKALEKSDSVAVYVKLPKGFYISTPFGRYNPDWAIAFYEGKVKHIYFVAETKGTMNSLQLRLIEEKKIECARQHFKAISGDNVVYDVIDSYESLLNKVMQ